MDQSKTNTEFAIDERNKNGGTGWTLVDSYYTVVIARANISSGRHRRQMDLSCILAFVDCEHVLTGRCRRVDKHCGHDNAVTIVITLSATAVMRKTAVAAARFSVTKSPPEKPAAWPPRRTPHPIVIVPRRRSTHRAPPCKEKRKKIQTATRSFPPTAEIVPSVRGRSPLTSDFFSLTRSDYYLFPIDTSDPFGRAARDVFTVFFYLSRHRFGCPLKTDLRSPPSPVVHNTYPTPFVSRIAPSRTVGRYFSLPNFEEEVRSSQFKRRKYRAFFRDNMFTGIFVLAAKSSRADRTSTERF